ncbi:MAG TPA: DUF4198 domain-containing protein [Kofleriaceae bacterium]|nr:DUF4198 domain-containing protein [Kofleriaceae bacterium]
MARVLTAAAILAVALRADAHDYWMVPLELVVDGDREVTVSLFVGEDFLAEDAKRFERARFPRLAHLHTGQIDDLLGSAVEGAQPLLRLPIRGAGGHLVVADRSPSRIELEARKFERYLEHEGLRAVIAERARLGESNKPGRERYSRYLKTLIQLGPARDETYAASAGQRIEILPEANPVFVEPGATLPVLVRFEGQPLANAWVEAFSRNGADIRGASYTTDVAGRIRVAIDRRGVWLIRLVHMVRCAGCPDADWESFWTSYSFASANPAGGTVASPSMFAPKPRALGRTVIFVAVAAAAALAGVIYLRRRRR